MNVLSQLQSAWMLAVLIVGICHHEVTHMEQTMQQPLPPLKLLAVLTLVYIFDPAQNWLLWQR
jgi:hypothetical protein